MISLKKAFRKLFPRLFTIYTGLSVLAVEQGYWRSIRSGQAVNKKGEPIPWYTYPALEYLNSFDFSDCKVFEFGSGNSSKYWSGRVASIVSVEDDEEWYRFVKNCCIENQSILHRPEITGYVNSLPEQETLYDIIIVDGKWRYESIIESVEHLCDGGVIILDNSDRVDEKKCSEFLRSKDFIQIDFNGFGPINGYSWTTSVFFADFSSLKRRYLTTSPIGGLSNQEKNSNET